jgi:methyl-accepting chemotaxis protein
MASVLTPAVAVMNRLRFTGKFALVIMVLMVAVGALVTLLYIRLDAAIVHSQTELEGLKMIQPLSRAVQSTQQHRGLSAAVLGGNAERKADAAAKAKEIESHLTQTEALLSASLRGSAEWTAIRSEWGRLASEGMNLQLSANIAAHTRLIGRMLVFVSEVSDSARLTQDPDVGSFYLMETSLIKLPALLETLGRMRAAGTGVLAAGKLEPAQATTLNIALASIADLRGQYERNLAKTMRENSAVAGTLDASAKKFIGELEQLSALVREDVLGQKFATPATAFFAQATSTIDIGYTQMFETLMPTLEQLINQRMEKVRGQMTLTLLVIGAVLAIAAYLVAGMYQAVTANIRRLAEGADRIASGDLTVRIDLQCRDELMQVAGSFNRMATAVNDTVRNVRTNADAVSSAAERTATSSGEIALSSQNQSEAASSMAAAVEQTTVGIDHISTNARDARDISARSGELSAQGGDLVQTVVAEMGEIASAVSASASAVEELGRRSDEISSIVEVIKEIADQTNLLALNAAIEAARAGEQGRGFAVVADEVRKLAERTAKSTQQISAMIGSIQQETRSAVDAMKAGVDKVDRGVELTSRAGEAMAEVRRGADQVVEVVREISDALREQTAASSDIARNVETIAQMAEENSAAVSENHATAEQLEKLAAALQNEVARFKVS